MFATPAARMNEHVPAGGWSQPSGAQVANPRRLRGRKSARLVCHEEKLNGGERSSKPTMAVRIWAHGPCWRLFKRLMKCAPGLLGRALYRDVLGHDASFISYTTFLGEKYTTSATCLSNPSLSKAERVIDLARVTRLLTGLAEIDLRSSLGTGGPVRQRFGRSL